MRKPKNRMAVVETRDPVQPSVIKRKPGQCPKCGGDAPVVSELMANNAVRRRRVCSKCGESFTE